MEVTPQKRMDLSDYTAEMLNKNIAGIERQKRTSGKWCVWAKRHNTNNFHIIQQYTSKKIATGIKNVEDGFTMAKAPEMLEALKRARPWLTKALAEGINNKCVAPKDLETTLLLVDNILKELGE